MENDLGRSLPRCKEIAMPDDPRVQILLDELLDSDATPEEVCGSCIELLPVVRDRWRQVCQTRAELDAMFPPVAKPGTSGPSQRSANALLPTIPGYEVEAVLGVGGMGVVFRARHMGLNRTVALKMALAGAYAGPHERARFQREAEAVAALRHPNVVQIYEVGEAEGRPYFTMEYVEGGSLSEKLAGTPLPAREAAALVATLAGAVQAAHSAGVVHRDLKPANIFLTADGTPKVGDFGLARRVYEDADLTRSGTTVGTPSYMAPEQARGHSDTVGPSADVYSLGAILYELLTGRPPFKAETSQETVQQLLSQDPVSPSRLNRTVPRDLDSVCLTCLRKDPSRRYSAAAALADDLGRFLRGETTMARPEGLVARWGRRVRQRPVLAAAVAASMLLAVALACAGAWMLSERRAVVRAVEVTEKAADDDLKELVELLKASSWVEARAAWERAKGRLGNSNSIDLRHRLEQGKRDLELVANLEEARLVLSGVIKSNSAKSHSPEEMYARAFRNYEIDLEMLESEDAAHLIRTSAIQHTLLEYLHEWLYWISDAKRERIQSVADAADRDDWRREYRRAIAAKDRNPAKLIILASSPETADQPPAILSGLCGGLLIHGHRAIAADVLVKAQRQHPGDFWLNYLLGHFWAKERPQHAVGYFRVAVAIRPTSDQAYFGLARALRDAGEMEEAAVIFGKAATLNTSTAVIKEWAKILAPAGQLEKARGVWEKFLQSNPPDHDSWYGYAQLCLFLGDEQAYRSACQTLFDRFENTSDGVAAERTSLAGLLLPTTEADLRRACSLANRAAEISVEKDSPYLLFLNGLVEYRLGRFDHAIRLLEAVAPKLPERAGPRLVLAMAQYRSGSVKEARETLASALRDFNWDPSRADHTTAWVSHVFRREAESIIQPAAPHSKPSGTSPR